MNKKQIEQAKQDSLSLREMQLKMLDTMKKIHSICEKHNIRYWVMYGSLLGSIRHDGFIPWDDDMDIMMPRRDFLKFMDIAQTELGSEYFLQTPNTDRKYDILHVPIKVRDNHSTLVEELNRDYHQGAFVDIFVMDYVGDDLEAMLKIHKKTSFLASLKMPIDHNQLHGMKRYIRIFLQLLFKLVPIHLLFNYLQKQSIKVLDNDKKSENGIVGLEFLEKDIFPLNSIFPLQLHVFEDSEFYIPNNPDEILKNQYGDYMKLPSEDEKIAHGLFYGNKRFYEMPKK